MLDYRPDLDTRTPGLVLTMYDMIPTERGYRVAYRATNHTAHTYSLAANEVYPNKLFASRWLSTPGGIVLVGTNQKLSVYDYTNGFINVSKAGNYSLGGQSYQYGEDATAAFDMCAFSDVIIACNRTVATQSRSALDLTSGTLFADLSANAPAAATCCVANNFVFLGNVGNWSTGPVVTGANNMLVWSAIGDHTGWVNNPTVTQCSYAVFSDTPGPITAIRPFRDGVVVFKAHAMYHGRYVGTGTNSPIWDFVRISDKVGCLGPSSLTNIDTALVFVGIDDVYSYDGTRPVSITHGIRTRIQPNITAAGNHTMRAGHDKPNNSVWLSGGGNSNAFVWNYRFNRWGYLENSNKQVLCETNADDFRKKTLSTVTAGVQSYTTTTDHYNLYTLTIDQLTPKNRNTSYSTTSNFQTGIFGDANALHTLKRVNPLFTSAPTSASVIALTSRLPNGGGSGGAVAMNTTTYRMDMLGQPGMTNNWFSFLMYFGSSCEIIDVVPTLVPAGAR